jgi:microcystin-dependent protein
MSDQYVGEIRLFAGNFAPSGWALCQGQLLSIQQNPALFSLLGTQYGGNGTTNFGLPDLRGRVPIHQGSGGGGSYVMGEQGGTEYVSLMTMQMPAHTHPAHGSSTSNGDNISPANELWSGSTDGNTPYTTNPPNTIMDRGVIGVVGGSQPHTNLQPLVCLTYIIALQGVFPSRS